MEIYRELHQGWLIVVVQEVQHWLFECHRPETDPYSAINLYASLESALSAARQYIALETAQSALQQAVS